MNEEKWVPIKGYEGLYEVSNLGQIRRVGRKILKQSMRGSYLKVSLYKNGQASQQSVHRIVAQNFLPNPDNLPQVNHKDENKLNNRLENLEWCTHKYNSCYGTAIEKSRKNLKKPVIGTSLATGEEFYFDCINEAERQGFANHSHIVSCLKGKDRRKTAGGYSWKYVNPEDE